MTRQPKWKLVAQLGDVHPVDYGGYFVYEDETGVYAPEAEWLESPDNDEGTWRVYRFSLDKCTLTSVTDTVNTKTGLHGEPYTYVVLSDNPYHPLHSVWFAPSQPECDARPQDSNLSGVAVTMGTTIDELHRLFCSESATDRAEAYREVGLYHGFENLDSYPLTFTNRAEVEQRYAE